MTNTPLPAVLFPKGFLSKGIKFIANPALLTTITVDDAPEQIPLAELEAVNAAMSKPPLDRDGEWRLYAIPFAGRTVNVEIGWGQDSFTCCERPGGLTPRQERVLETIVKNAADMLWDAACEVSDD